MPRKHQKLQKEKNGFFHPTYLIISLRTTTRYRISLQYLTGHLKYIDLNRHVNTQKKIPLNRFIFGNAVTK